MTTRISRALLAFVAILGLVTSISLAQVALAVPSYPTAAEVAAAKKKVSTKKAMIKRIEAIIVDLETKADAAERVALIKGEAYNIAKEAYDQKAAQVATLQSQADAAMAQANQAQQQLGQIAGQMYRSGTAGTSLNLFLNSSEASDLLYQLGAQDKLAQSSNTIYLRSIQKQKYAQSLANELSAAKIELAARQEVAQTAFEGAQTAANTAQSLVDSNVSLNKTFYAQLASLQNTSAELERQRAEGLAAERRQAAGSAKMEEIRLRRDLL